MEEGNSVEVAFDLLQRQYEARLVQALGTALDLAARNRSLQRQLDAARRTNTELFLERSHLLLQLTGYQRTWAYWLWRWQKAMRHKFWGWRLGLWLRCMRWWYGD